MLHLLGKSSRMAVSLLVITTVGSDDCAALFLTVCQKPVISVSQNSPLNR